MKRNDKYNVIKALCEAKGFALAKNRFEEAEKIEELIKYWEEETK